MRSTLIDPTHNKLLIFRQNQLLSVLMSLLLSYFTFQEDQSSLFNSLVLVLASLAYAILLWVSFWVRQKIYLYLTGCWLTLSLIGYFLTDYALLSSPALPWLCCVPSLLVFFLEGRLLKCSASVVFSFLLFLLYRSWQMDFSVQFASPQRDQLVLISAICALLYSFFLSFALWRANRRIASHLSRQSELDFLTGTLNRRAFSQHLDRRKQSTFEQYAGVGVSMIDIDDFKRINDTYGHQIGDEVIKMVGKTIQSALREGDIVARYGGEEFIVLFENIAQSDLQSINQRIVRHVRRNSETWSEFDLSVTVSAGSAFGKGPQTDRIHQLIATADQKLYQAKRSGKNQWVFC